VPGRRNMAVSQAPKGYGKTEENSSADLTSDPKKHEHGGGG